jgi:beta-glucosidase
MCSYNQINNSYGCSNSYTMNYLLKGELGFQGFIMSDWGAQHAGVSTALAGLDMAMPGDSAFDSGDSYWGANMTLAVLNGTLPEWRLDDMATRIIAAYYLTGRDKYKVPVNFNSWSRDTFGYQHAIAKEGYGLINQHVDVRGEHRNNIRDAAARSTVLLKNNGVLPLTGSEKFTAVFGEDAETNLWGPNGCPDRGCDNGTLAMGWGSGTADFPYLVTPLTAIQNKVLTTSGGIVQSVTDNWAYSQIQLQALQASVSIVFINADSGEGYISVDGNEGDRNNLTAWKNGETLIQNVTSQCNNTIVVVHSVGPILLTNFYDNPNVTAIVWASLPGEQSGNSLVDVLYGDVNPGGKLPFTLAAKREDYGTDLLYEPNNGGNAPQDEFTEGVFIDYRYFDKNDIDPIYEFGYGLSYTSFSYSNLQVQTNSVGVYVPTTGTTEPAPVLGSFSNDTADYQYPSNFTAIPLYIYPYLNDTDLTTAAASTDYGLPSSQWLPPNSANSTAQPRIPAGGAPGGNAQLYDVLFTVTATITNTGSVTGDEVVQLYVSRGGPNDPVRELRGFERLNITPGGAATFSADLTRRDLSNWDPASQNWVITSYPKTVYVGASSRNLALNGTLDLSNVGGGECQPKGYGGGC